MRGPVLFSKPEFNCLANNSAFQVVYRGINFPTAEHAYQYSRFYDTCWEVGQHDNVGKLLLKSASVNDALRIAFTHQDSTEPTMSGTAVMSKILKCKFDQHEDVRKVINETFPRLLMNDVPNLIEDQDEIWGQGKFGSGVNQLGKVWMQVRQAQLAAS